MRVATCLVGAILASFAHAASAASKGPVCNADNCLRNLRDARYSSSASAFCKTYTATTNTATTGFPTYLSNCPSKPTALSSACTCFTATVTSSTSSKTSSSTSSSSTSTTTSSTSTSTSTTSSSSTSTSTTTSSTSTSTSTSSTSTSSTSTSTTAFPQCTYSAAGSGNYGVGGCTNCYCNADVDGVHAYCGSDCGPDGCSTLCTSDSQCPAGEFCDIADPDDFGSPGVCYSPGGCVTTYGSSSPSRMGRMMLKPKAVAPEPGKGDPNRPS